MIRQKSLPSMPKQEENTDSKGWFDFDGDVDLRGLDPGVYELRIMVKDAQSNKAVQRATVFGIE